MDAEPAAERGRRLAAEFALLDRDFDRVARRIEKCRARIRQYLNDVPTDVKEPGLDGDGDIAAIFAQTISASKAAERFGLSTDTIVRMGIRHGAGVKVGHRWRIFPARIRKVLSAAR